MKRRIASTGGIGGGALIVDKFGDDDGEQKNAGITGQRRAAVELEMEMEMGTA